ncbi:hypothetical protein CCS92_34815, partial [Methylobacterium radiotolerans]
LRADWVAPLVDLKGPLSLGNGQLTAALEHPLIPECPSRLPLTVTSRTVAATMTRPAAVRAGEIVLVVRVLTILSNRQKNNTK